MRGKKVVASRQSDNRSLMSLRLKVLSLDHFVQEDFSEALDVLNCMKSTDERKYVCRDYIKRRELRRLQNQSQSDSDKEELAEDIDATCRWKMCEWAYRVSDHFQASRETVSLAFSILDRFIDRCSCDRTAFKLASMTSLYIAAKLINIKEISINNLVELSRGEFEMKHIVDMEDIILRTLDWALSPPTVQAFLSRFIRLLPYEDPLLTKSVHEKANFFAELSVYDYFFVTERRHFVAMVCILNAMEAVGQAETDQAEFLENAYTSLSLNSGSDVHRTESLSIAQERIWQLYSCSAQLEQDLATHSFVGKDGDCECLQRGSVSIGTEPKAPGNYSPVSVVIKKNQLEENKLYDV